MSKRSFKLTNQRSVILDYVNGNYTHPTVDEVFAGVRENLPRISKKTVYSNLGFLCREGLVNEVNVKGAQRYEPSQSPHHHLVCRKCGRIQDLESKDLYSHVKKVAGRIKGFDAESFQVHFYGVCSKCREKESA